LGFAGTRSGRTACERVAFFGLGLVLAFHLGAQEPSPTPTPTPAPSLTPTPTPAPASAVPSAPAAASEAASGSKVVSLSYSAEGPVDAAEIGRLVEIRPGQPLTDQQTGATIRNLYATGRFADVQIETAPEGDGVAVVVRLVRSYQIRPLRFHGTKGISRDDLLRVLSFSEGDVYNAAEVEEGARALKRRFEEEGYLSCNVTFEVTLDEKRFRARVDYRFEPGTAARVALSFFDGDTKPYTPDELRRKAKLDPGDRYRESKARQDATRMSDFLHKETRLRATVELIAAQPTDDGRIQPVYRISVGPKVDFEATGISPGKLRRELKDLLAGQVFDEDLVLQYVENKKRELQGKGYYRAKVVYTLSGGTSVDDSYVVRVTIDPGPHEEIEKIAFLGNASVPEKTLLSLMLTRKRGLPFVRPGHLVEDELNEDASAILGYYQTHGWVGAKVDRPSVTEGSKPNRLVVTLTIHEGPRALVATRRIEGAEHASLPELEKLLRIRPHDPYNPALVREDVANLQVYYHDRGWNEAVVHGEPKLAPDGVSADVVYRVDEGMRSFFGRTIIRGNARTVTSRLRRLVTWQEGRPFSESELLNTQRNLSRAGVFSRVDVKPQPPDPATAQRNVEIELKEGKPLSLLYGVGYQYTPDAPSYASDPFVVGGISYKNLFGRMLSAGLEGQISISGRYRLQLTYRDPYLFSRDVALSSYFFATREPIQDVDIDRLGLVNEVSHYFGHYLRVALRQEYQRITPVNPENLSFIEANDFPRFDQPIKEATIGPTAFYDRRDDPIDPHRGYYSSLAVKYAFPIFSAEARYTKFSTQAAFFRPIRKSVFAASVRFGGIFPYGPPTIQVPIAERFFAGGQSTGRGFEQDLVGIPGETVDYDTRATLHTGSGAGSCAPTFPNAAAYDCNAGPHIVGGNGFLAANAEFRFPIFGDLGGTVFYDLAQVWKDFSDLNVRFEGDDGLRQTAGVGLRYMTPIGPLRAEYGMPLQPKTIPYDITTPPDADGNCVSGTVLAKGRCVLGHGTVKEKGRFIITIGYPF
jgi:outer membrane protein insertion porin family